MRTFDYRSIKPMVSDMSTYSNDARQFARIRRIGHFLAQETVFTYASSHAERPLHVPYERIVKEVSQLREELPHQFSAKEVENILGGYFSALENTIHNYKDISSHEAQRLLDSYTKESYPGLILPEGCTFIENR